MNTLTLTEAAAYLKCNAETVRVKAKAREIKAVKVGRQWVFKEEDLSSYLDKLYDGDFNTVQPPCNTIKRGLSSFGTDSPLLTDDEYEDLLRPPTNVRPRN